MNRSTPSATSRAAALAAGTALLLIGCGDEAARQAKSDAQATAARPAAGHGILLLPITGDAARPAGYVVHWIGPG
jgi:hypothetical protein